MCRLPQTAGMALASDQGPGDGDGQLPRGWQQVGTLRLAEIVMTILGARKEVPTATAATVSRERYGAGFHVRVSLLSDGSSDPDGGSAGVIVADFAAQVLGPDLEDAFKGKDVIVLK